MTSPIRCRDCRYFQPWAPNAGAAMGRCLHDARHGYWFAGELHRCGDYAAKAEAKPEVAHDPRP